MNIRIASAEDSAGVLALYRCVAAIPGGIARLAEEVDETYVVSFLSSSVARGLALVALDNDGKVVGEIHAYRPEPFCFGHVMSDLTIVVDPSIQGYGIGRQLFECFIAAIVKDNRDISRIELIARESNWRAIQFYESLGFCREGRLAGRIKNVDGSLESDIPMGWLR